MAYKLLTDKEEPSSSKELFHRLPAQAASRVASSVVGLPGDVASILNEYVAGPISKAITGKEPLKYEETYLGKALPTSYTHQKSLEEGIPYLKPKNKLEKFVGDVASDTASLMIPGKVLTKGMPLLKTSGLKNFSTALGANLFGEAVQDLTGDEKKAAYAKMGSLFSLSLLNKPSAAKMVGDLYKNAESKIPKGAKTSASSLETSLNSLKDRVLSGRKETALAPSERFVVDEANKVLSMIEEGKIGVSTAWAAKRSLNENLRGIFQSIPEKEGRNRAKTLTVQINRDLGKTIKDYGRENPEFYKNFSSADEAFSTLSKSNYISNFISSNIKHSLVTHGLLHALGVGGTATGAVIPYQAAKIMHRIIKSPTLRKYYSSVLKAASQEDVASFNRELQKLDNGLSREEGKGRKNFRILD